MLKKRKRKMKFWNKKIFLFSLIFLITFPLQASTDCREKWSPLINKSGHIYRVSKKDETFKNNLNLTYQKYIQSLNRKNCKKDWTILVYMQADNDLTPYAFWDLYEMQAAFKKRLAGSTLKTDLIVQLDTQLTDKMRRLHIFQSQKPYEGTKDFHEFSAWTEEQIESPTIELLDENEISKASQKNEFQDFIQWGLKNYPSKNTMIIIWGHGQGWSADTAVQFGGIAFDDSQNSKLTIPDIVNSFKKDQKVSVITSDACLMQTVEVATELSAKAKYVVGSTQVHNFLGLPYRRLLYEINSNHFLGLKKELQIEDESYLMAKMLPPLFKQSFDPRFGLQGRVDPEGIKSLTMSSINTSELVNVLIPELDGLGKSLIAYSKEDPFRSRMLKVHLEKMPHFLGSSRDLGTLLGYIKEFIFSQKTLSQKHRDIGIQVDRVLEAVNLTLVSYSFGEDYRSFYNLSHYFISFFKAFGIWMPNSKNNYMTYKNQFNETQLYKNYLAKSWSKWIDELYSNQPLMPFSSMIKKW